MMKRLFLVLLLILGVVGIGRTWYLFKDGFSVNRISPSHACQAFSDIQNSTYVPYLDQTYHYLARGRQCYAFLSKDGLYVLKIPRLDLFRTSLLWRSLPSFLFKREKILKKEGKQNRALYVLGSFQIAANELREPSGILYDHLSITSHLPSCLLLTDSMKRVWKVNPNNLIFVIQKNTDLLIPLIISNLREKNFQKVQKMLGSFVDLLEKRSRLGIFNKDPSFRKNFGWKDNASYQIDIGSFYHKPEEKSEQALKESLSTVRSWFVDNAPEIVDLFDILSQEKLCIYESSSS